MSEEQKLSDKIRETASKISDYTDSVDSFNIYLQDMDEYQLARILTRLKLVENIMLDVWRPEE